MAVTGLSQADRDHNLLFWYVVWYMAITIMWACMCMYMCAQITQPYYYLYAGKHGQEWVLLEEETCGNLLSPSVLECKQD